MKILSWLGALFLAFTAQAQVVSFQQMTNLMVKKTNGVIWTEQSWGASGLAWRGFNHPLFQSTLLLMDSNVVKWRYLGLSGSEFGADGSPVQIGGDLRVLGIARNAASVEYATTLDTSNDVRVAAGAGINVASSGAAGVQTFTVTATFGSGATNAISSVTTNGALIGVGLTGLGFTNGADTIVSGYSNGGSAFIAFSLDPSVKINLTNFALSIGAAATSSVMQASSTLATAIGTLGTNSTNYANLILGQAQAFAYTIGGNATSYVNDAYSSLSNDTRNVFLANSNSALNSFLANSNANLLKQDATKVLNDLTNSGIQFVGNMQSNVSQIYWQLQNTPVPTNSSQSNVVVNLRTNKYYLTITNNITLTNFTGLSSRSAYDVTIWVLPQLINRSIAYPTLGGDGYGIHAFTNANSPMWTTLTQGVLHAISISGFDTNLVFAITAWK